MNKKRAYPTSLIIRFITFIFFSVFARIYKIKKVMPEEVKRLKPPYLILGNHVGYWDPFVTGNFLPHFTHFVSSDAAFRKPLIRLFLNGLGTIPKKKNIRDTKVIRDIISVIKQGENIGIFPEAVRNWAGKTQPVDASIAKLIKLLKVPVVVPVLKGMNLFNPRWSRKLRRAKVEVEYKLLFSKNDVKTYSENKIFKLLENAMFHDEVEWQRKHKIKIHSNRRAEFINHTIYYCPECQGIDSFRAKENDFKCVNCNYDIHINEYGFFERISKGNLYFDNIRDWFEKEENYLLNFINNKLKSNYKDVIFEDLNSEIYHSKEDVDLKFIGIADVKLFANRIEINFKEKEEVLTLNFDDLQTINPQVNERLEIYYSGEAYRIIGGREGVSALKWEVALNAIWKYSGQNHKLSPYINNL
ncbi:MAG: 1-acyl-sn-glycerol-3-phosphate acyltransferase [Bacteroidales bacterium]|nr:1-acyl-sn-glycerol-3-phosphate acyltransferase [Bacteroidales bacterium]